MAQSSNARVAVYVIDEDEDRQLVRSKPKRVKMKKEQRAYIWAKTGGICYLCKIELEIDAPWHVEHVFAFSKDPTKNDVLGNMLPSCAHCNLVKGNRPLDWCMRSKKAYSLATGVALNENLSVDGRVRAALLEALETKWKLKLEGVLDVVRKTTTLSDDHADMLMSSLEEAVSGQPVNVAANTRCPFVPYSRLHTKKQRLGTGGQGSVHLFSFKQPASDPVDVALKKYEVSAANPTSLFRELATLGGLQHPNLVHVYGWSFHDGDFGTSLFVVMERLSYDLFCTQGKALFWDHPLSALHHISSALMFLHDLNIMHRDIKPHNIMVLAAKPPIFKLCDFGCARKHDSQLTSKTGTAYYRAPEMASGNYTNAVDLYALGKALCILVSSDEAEEKDYVQEIKLISDRCVASDPLKRPRARDLCLELESMDGSLKAIPGAKAAPAHASGPKAPVLVKPKFSKPPASVPAPPAAVAPAVVPAVVAPPAIPSVAAPVQALAGKVPVPVAAAHEDVFVKSPTSKSYHKRCGCYKAEMEIPLAQALRNALEPCKRCFKD